MGKWKNEDNENPWNCINYQHSLLFSFERRRKTSSILWIIAFFYWFDVCHLFKQFSMVWGDAREFNFSRGILVLLWWWSYDAKRRQQWFPDFMHASIQKKQTKKTYERMKVTLARVDSGSSSFNCFTPKHTNSMFKWHLNAIPWHDVALDSMNYREYFHDMIYSMNFTIWHRSPSGKVA